MNIISTIQIMIYSFVLVMCATIFPYIEKLDFTDIMLFDNTHSIPESEPVMRSVPSWTIRDNGKGNKVFGFNIFTSPDTILSPSKDERELLHGPCGRNCSPPLLISVSNQTSGIRALGSVSSMYVDAFKSKESRNRSENVHFSDSIDRDGNTIFWKNYMLPRMEEFCSR